MGNDLKTCTLDNRKLLACQQWGAAGDLVLRRPVMRRGISEAATIYQLVISLQGTLLGLVTCVFHICGMQQTLGLNPLACLQDALQSTHSRH